MRPEQIQRQSHPGYRWSNLTSLLMPSIHLNSEHPRTQYQCLRRQPPTSTASWLRHLPPKTQKHRHHRISLIRDSICSSTALFDPHHTPSSSLAFQLRPPHVHAIAPPRIPTADHSSVAGYDTPDRVAFAATRSRSSGYCYAWRRMGTVN